MEEETQKEQTPQPEEKKARPGRLSRFLRRWRHTPLQALLRLILLLVLAAGLFLYWFYRANRETIMMLAGDLVEAQTHRLFASQTTFSRMETPELGHFIFHDFRIADPSDSSRHFLFVRRVEVKFDPLRLIWRGINLSFLQIENADCWVHHDSLADAYNIEMLFRSSGNKDPGKPKDKGSGTRIRIRHMVISELHARLEDLDDKPIENRIHHLEGNFTHIGGENLVEVNRSHIWSDYRQIGLIAYSGIVTIRGSFLGFQESRVVKGATDLTGAGFIDFHTHAWRYDVQPGRLNMEDLPPELGLSGELIGPAMISATFGGTFDSAAILARISVPRGTIFGYPVQDLSTVLRYDSDRLSFENVSSGVAGGAVNGDLYFLFGRAGSGYHAVFETREVDIARLRFDFTQGVRGKLGGHVELDGQGYDEASLDLEVRGRGLRGQLFEVPVDSAQVDYTLHQGRSRLDDLALYSSGAVLTAIGDLKNEQTFLFVLVEQLPAQRLVRWFPVEGLSGMLDFSGSLSGNLDDPELRGTFTLTDGSYGKLQFSRMDGKCDLHNVVTRANGTFDAEFGAAGFAGLELSSIRVSTTVPDSGNIRFDPLSVVQDSLNSLFCRGTYLPVGTSGEFRLDLDTLSILYAGRRAVAEGSIQLHRHGDTTQVSGIRLRALGGEVSGEITALDSGWFDTAIAFHNLDLQRLPDSLKPPFDLAGRAEGRLMLSGTLQEPTGSVELNIDDPVLWIMHLDQAAGRLRLDRENLRIDSLALSGAGTVSTVQGVVPLSAFADYDTDHQDNHPVSLQVRFNAFPLNALRSKVIPFSAGRIDGELEIGGTPERPSLSGKIGLSAGEGLIAPINTRLQNMNGRLELTGGSLVLNDLSSSSPEGKLKISGRIPLDGFHPDSLDIAVSGRDLVLQQFRYVTSLRVNADLTLRGPVSRPLLDGTVKVTEGEISPAFGAAVPGSEEESTSPAGTPELRLPVLPIDYDLRFSAQENFWLRNRNAGIKLTANLRATQKEGKPAVNGQITTVAGYYSVFGRRFQLKYGSIQFQSQATINPLLDINAERTVRGRVLRTDLVGSSWSLQSTTGSSLAGEQYEMDSNTFALHIGGTLNSPRFDITVRDVNDREIEPPLTPEMARSLVLVDQTYREFQQQSGLSQSKLLDQAANMALNQANPYLQEWTGLDELSFESQLFTRQSGTGAEDQNSDRASAKLTMGEFLFEKVFFSFSQDLIDPSARSAQIEYLINRSSSVVGQTDSQGHFSLDFRYLIKY